LSLTEREKIFRGLAAGISMPAIATGLGGLCRRAVARCSGTAAAACIGPRGPGGAVPGCSSEGHELASLPALTAPVTAKLELDWSPEQIAVPAEHLRSDSSLRLGDSRGCQRRRRAHRRLVQVRPIDGVGVDCAVTHLIRTHRRRRRVSSESFPCTYQPSCCIRHRVVILR